MGGEGRGFRKAAAATDTTWLQLPLNNLLYIEQEHQQQQQWITLGGSFDLIYFELLPYRGLQQHHHQQQQQQQSAQKFRYELANNNAFCVIPSWISKICTKDIEGTVYNSS